MDEKEFDDESVAKETEKEEQEGKEVNLENKEEGKRDEFDELIDGIKNGDEDITNRRLLDLRENHNRLRSRIFELEKTVMERDKQIRDLHDENLDRLMSGSREEHEEKEDKAYEDIEENKDDEDDYLSNVIMSYSK